ncbi:MAG: AAA family ATPase [Bacteroidota bacterium]|uniref:ATP-binding protein n=1 Tax=Parabacteroides sp. FAFU027 TaxID=2922715 RepID=UPI001FAF3745|nr:AAA family ATPase [Parabacteroides sp. FAFU027]MDP4269525.1 AAA family ATPase [Bacteroidota bacterium]
MEAFYRTHKYLVENVNSPVRRDLMNEINWNSRLIGIKGSRGVGKTTFLLQYAKDNFGTDRSCLYINMNHLYFTDCTLLDFARKFVDDGGKTLLIDQIFKYPNWSEELKLCYETLPELKIVFTGSSAMRLKEENPVLFGLVDSYFLRGLSFREFLNLIAGKDFKSYSLEEILADHKNIAEEICRRVNPQAFFQDYLHHGFYPFFLEKQNFTESLIKTINLMIESDIFFLKQIELSYYQKIRKLLYLLANSPGPLNISQLSIDINTSRATVMNYIKYLKDARLINMLYAEGDEYPKKPAMIYLHNTNLIYPLQLKQIDEQNVRETFFYNVLYKDNYLNTGGKNVHFKINNKYNFRIEGENMRGKINPDFYYAQEGIKVGNDRIIPLWLFGFLY